MSVRVLVCLAPGSEEIEAVTTVDLLVRAGIRVTTASVASIASNRAISASDGIASVASDTVASASASDSVTRASVVRASIASDSVASDSDLTICCSRGVRLLADAPLVTLADEEFDALVLPGGAKGAQCFASSPLLLECIRQYQLAGRLVAAICATPALVLIAHDLYPHANMTGFPALREHIPAAQWRDKRVYFDRRYNLLTSQGPGTSLDFALKIIALLCGKPQAAMVASQLILPAGIGDYQHSSALPDSGQ